MDKVRILRLLSAPRRRIFALMVNESDIDAAIEAREAEVEKMRKKLKEAEIELRGMKDLRSRIFGMLGVKQQPAPASDSQFSLKGGRQPGAISQGWRMILSDAYHDNEKSWFTENYLIAQAQKYDIVLRAKDAKARLLNYQAHAYVEEKETGSGIWRVTESAAKRFNFADARLADGGHGTKSAPDPEEIGAD